MAFGLWSEIPLVDTEGLKEGNMPTVIPIDKIRDEDNCGEVTM